MANAKSFMRKKLGIRGPRRRKRRGKSNGEAAAIHAAPRVRIPASALEKLEGMIDGVLFVAREHEAAGLQAVVRHLRDARNGVVMEQRS